MLLHLADRLFGNSLIFLDFYFESLSKIILNLLLTGDLLLKVVANMFHLLLKATNLALEFLSASGLVFLVLVKLGFELREAV
jgi:hypothetical protein